MKTKHVALLAVVAFAGLLFAPAPASAQSILLTAGNYALLGGADVTNTSSTAISGGNVGSLTSVIGFSNDPGTVTGGTVYVGTGAPNSTAITDLNTARVGLSNMTYLPANDFTSTGTLGGRTLSPGVYHFDAAADLTGTLTLDAGGQNGVYWVFQIGSSLTAAANSVVTLINPGTNGGKDNGIFWVAETGSFTFGNTSTILGNYIAYASVSFSGATNPGGSGGSRALAYTGGVTFAGAGTVNALGGPSSSDWTGGLTYDLSNNVVAVPEPPSTSVLIAGFLGLVVGVRRIRRHYSDRKLGLRA